MEKFTQYTGVDIPLRRNAVDTGQIIPAVHLRCITRTGFEDALFVSWRKDPSFVLNREEYRRGSVFVAGPDFGTGSSRKHVVWALKDYGFRVVFAPKFAGIFRGNADKQGLVTGVMAQEDVEQLWKILETNPGVETTVDLGSWAAHAEGFVCHFDLDDYIRWWLMEGLDDVGTTLQSEGVIEAYEASRLFFRLKMLPEKHLPPAAAVSTRPVDRDAPLV